MLIKAIYIQICVVGLTLIWFALSRRRSDKDLGLKIIAIAIFLIALGLGSIWVYPPYWALALIGFVFCAVSVFKWKQTAPNKYHTAPIARTLFSNLPVLIILPLGLYIGIQGFLGHRQNAAGLSLDLSPPFTPDQRACVMSGGLNSLVNQHNFGSSEPVNIGQIYGLDIIRLGPAGFRTRPEFRLDPKPSDYRAYNMFDTQVYAPCAGQVVWMENNRIEQAIGTSDKDWTSGNGVTLACGDIHVKLSHMKMGSLLVKHGDWVEPGAPLGRIGNSGNTEEPHLHLHAETVIEPGNPWVHGEPVHMRFNGKLMARGDCF